MLINLRNHRGDTIVEVLIAIAIVSLTLTGAYASVNRSSNATRTAQERGEALKWAESQVEQIKASKNLPGTGSFCFTTNQQLQSGSTTCDTTNGVTYKAIIQQSGTTTRNYSVIVTWDALGSGTTQNTVELDYAK